MAPHSVIVDLAATAGGNCELTVVVPSWLGFLLRALAGSRSNDCRWSIEGDACGPHNAHFRHAAAELDDAQPQSLRYAAVTAQRWGLQ